MTELFQDSFSGALLFCVFMAFLGGWLAKLLKFQQTIGYLLVGLLVSLIFPVNIQLVNQLSQIGFIFLMFALGMEIPFSRLKNHLKPGLLAGVGQMVLTTVLLTLFLKQTGFSGWGLVIAAFSLAISSTAIVIKLIGERGETETVHGEWMTAILLIQDLTLVPAIILLQYFSQRIVFGQFILIALFKVVLVSLVLLLVGLKFIPKFVKQVAGSANQELMLLGTVLLALGAAFLTSKVGISAAIGAFIAGIVVARTQEIHLVFSETRTLRDLFMSVFLFSIGYLANTRIILENILLVMVIVIGVMLIKFVIFFLISQKLGYRGKTAFYTGIGLSQVSEYALVLLPIALSFKMINSSQQSVLTGVVVVTMMVSTIIFRFSRSIWLRIIRLSEKLPPIKKLTVYKAKVGILNHPQGLTDHIIVWGYGRMGKWVVKALQECGIKYLVVETNENVVHEARREGVDIIMGDPSEESVFSLVGATEAKAVVIAVNDRYAQEDFITKIQTVAPQVKILSRAHFADEVERLRFLRVDQVIQPEFEASIAVVKRLLRLRGKSPKEVSRIVTSLRISKSVHS